MSLFYRHHIIRKTVRTYEVREKLSSSGLNIAAMLHNYGNCNTRSYEHIAGGKRFQSCVIMIVEKHYWHYRIIQTLSVWSLLTERCGVHEEIQFIR